MNTFTCIQILKTYILSLLHISAKATTERATRPRSLARKAKYTYMNVFENESIFINVYIKNIRWVHTGLKLHEPYALAALLGTCYMNVYKAMSTYE